MTTQTTANSTRMTISSSSEPRPSGEFHHHGDPVFEAILKHDTEADEASRRKALKELYDEHARMVEHERAGAFLGDHTLWCLQDYLPEQPHGKKK